MKEFPPFRLDTVNQSLVRGDGVAEERVLLAPKAFDVLRYLVEHPGRLVPHDELLEALWPKTYVQPEVLKSHVAAIRAVLGDDARKPMFIETRSRRGYRFIAPVTESASASGAAASRPARILVGRDDALARLHQYLERMSSKGERQIVFVTGEPGIGKTAVADAFIDRAADASPDIRLARGQCIEGYGSREAYYPMLEVLAGLCRGDSGDAIVQILAAQAPTWLVQFPALLTPDRGEMLRREVLGATPERMLREIGDALEAMASRSPLVIVFEDLQWVDYSTVDLISVLARRRTAAKLMLVGTYRDDEVALSQHPMGALKRDLRSRHLCHEMALGRLSEAQVVDYLVAEGPESPLPDGLAALVCRHSEGNPLFMVATLDHLIGRGLIARERGWRLRRPLDEIGLAVPESLREMIEIQIERLSPEEQRVLEVASLTQSRAFSVIARAAAAMDADPGQFERICERLSRRTHILHPGTLEELPDGTISPFYEFSHALYREVLYNRIPPGRRARLHRQAADWAETAFAGQLSEAAPFLAYHFEHGGDYARAVKYLRIAAQTAGRRYAPREATAHLQHALWLSGRLPDSERATNELAVLEELAAMYLVSFDSRAVDTYEALAARAAASDLIDLEVTALVNMAYPLSWIDAERSLAVVDRALRLSTRQRDPLQQARTRVSCLVRRIWTGGWNARDAQDCREAVEQIRQSGHRHLLAAHLIDANFIKWVSSEYRTAHHDVVESLAALVERNVDNPYLSFVHWLSQFTLPWSLLFLGEWGEALRIITAEITLADKNGDRYRGQTLQLYRAWVYLHAMDFPGVLEICNPILPSLDEPPRRPWRRFCLVLTGAAEAALGRYVAASTQLIAARNEMDRQPVIHDWYIRMMLGQALTDAWLAKGDLTEARPEAERFLELTLATAERTWQALAWEASARVAMAEGDRQRARTCIDSALSAMEGFEVPLAAWRVHASAVELERRLGNQRAAARHRSLGRATVLALATSLVDHERLREAFLAATPVRAIIDPGQGTGDLSG
jgi:DNA-binding winged helix-turn-helix (wHTH) protein/tetratricopeptide (TPR) repeat protein